MEISLTGRSAVITGGSKGIGLAVAISFAEAGADVAILARGPEALERAAGAVDEVGPGRVIAIAADVANPGEIDRAYTEIMCKLGKIDIVVNNAGTSRTGLFEDLRVRPRSHADRPRRRTSSMMEAA